MPAPGGQVSGMPGKVPTVPFRWCSRCAIHLASDQPGEGSTPPRCCQRSMSCWRDSPFRTRPNSHWKSCLSAGHTIPINIHER